MDTGDGHRFSLLVKKPVHAILLIFKQVKHQYNLQHFSYHYHHYNQRCISKFWQVRNLRLPFHLLLAKIYILASMFVGRVCLSVCYLSKFDFGKYVGWSCLSVCLSVYLFVCLYGNFTKSQKRLSQSSPNLVTSKHQSMVPASSLDKNVAQITRSRGQKLGQILKSP